MLRRRRQPESTLVVPVPVVDGVVAEAGARLPTDLPAHVTLMYPFVAPAALDSSVERSLAAIAARFDPFCFELVALGHFPDVLYLEPRPAAAFAVLAEALLGRWPEHPPYGGRFPTFVPHVTVASRPAERRVVATIEAALPLACRAEEVVVFTQDDRRRWHARWRTPLGARAASGRVSR